MKRLGLTLLELVIAMAIIGLLIAILLPAVQASREAARRVECTNRMRQIATAVLSYESTHRVLPPANPMGHSYLVCILPQLEMDSVYRQASFERGGALALDNPLYKIPIVQFTCPSDDMSQRAMHRTDIMFPTNYVANRGVNTVDCGFNGLCQLLYPNFYGDGGYLTLPQVSDGQSNTAMLSETRVGEPSAMLGTSKYFGKGEYADFLHACVTGPYRAGPTGGLDILPSRGACWCRGADPDMTLYSHDLCPNAISCRNSNDVLSAALPPNSNHPGGAVVAYGDAHLSFVNDAVDPATWRAAGSRDGGEAAGWVP